MDDTKNIIELLLERVAGYSKTSYGLIKLKVLEKVLEFSSSFFPAILIVFLVSSCMLFVNLGLAFWLGKILNNLYYGFFGVAAFYAILAVFLHFVLKKWLKRKIGNYIIQKIFK